MTCMVYESKMYTDLSFIIICNDFLYYIIMSGVEWSVWRLGEWVAAGEPNGISSTTARFQNQSLPLFLSLFVCPPKLSPVFFSRSLFSLHHIMSSIKEQKAHQTLDQSSMPNFNSSWVNYKGKRVRSPHPHVCT